ncbi:MAG: MG2 domain-containing protein [Tissierellia bacterium]|nr:MG2 domain-containing protein [Tissierellia bacterium]
MKRICSILLAIAMVVMLILPSTALAADVGSRDRLGYTIRPTMSTDKEQYTLEDTAYVTLTLKDFWGRYISGQSVQMTLKTPSGTSYDVYKTTDYYGKAVMQVNLDQIGEGGDYTAIAYINGQEIERLTFKVIGGDVFEEKQLVPTIQLDSDEIETGSPLNFSVYVTNGYKQALQFAKVRATVTSPSGKAFTANGETDSRGMAYIKFAGNVTSEPGVYTIDVLATGYTFKDGRTSATFSTQGKPTAKEATLDIVSKNTYTRGESIVIEFEAKTDGKALVNAAIDIELEDANGKTYPSNLRTDSFGKGTLTIGTNSNSPLGKYYVRASMEVYGYQPVYRTVQFELVDENTEGVVLSVEADKSVYDTSEYLKIKATLTDSNGKAIGKKSVEYTITGPNNFTKKYKLLGDNHGICELNLRPSGWPIGEYRVIATIDDEVLGFASAETSFTLKDKDAPEPKALKATVVGADSFTESSKPYCHVDVRDENEALIKDADVTVELTKPGMDPVVTNIKTNYQARATWRSETTLTKGEYTLKFTIQKDGYKSVEVSHSFTVKESTTPDGESFNTRVETDEGQEIIERERDNPEFVLFDVRTKAEYMESHIEGAVQHDFYADDFDDYISALDKGKIYFIYCRTQNRSEKVANRMEELGFTRIYWMYGGMTKWLREGRPSVFPEYEKTLDVKIQGPKRHYKAGETMELNVFVQDLDDNFIRKGNVALTLKGPDGRVIAEDELVMGNDGTKVWTYNLPSNLKKGTYKVYGKGSHGEFKTGYGVFIFTIGSNEAESRMTFAQRKAKGQYAHLKEDDFEYQSLKKYYGVNILKYLVKDNKLKDHILTDLVDPNKKTLLVFGYPGCGPCVDMWIEMAKLKHEEYNFIEVVTSVEEDVQSTIDFTDGVLRDNDIWSLRDHIYYDAVDTIWGSRLDLLTTPNACFLDEQGRFVNISGPLDAQGLKDMMKKTFNLDINIDGSDPEPDPEPEPETGLRLVPEQDKEVVYADSTITFTFAAFDENNKPIIGKDVTVTLIRPSGNTITYPRKTKKTGIAKIIWGVSERSPKGKYGVKCEMVYKGKTVTATGEFTIGDGGDDNNLSTMKVTLTPEKKNIGTNETAYVKALVTDSRGSAISGASVSFTVTKPDYTKVNQTIRTDSYGIAKLTISSSNHSSAGKYRVNAEATRSGYNKAYANTEYTVSGSTPPNPDPDPDPGNDTVLTYEQRNRNGEFDHLRNNDLGPKLKNAYATNVKNYTITTLDGRSIKVGDVLDGKRPTVLGIGYPG